MEPWDELRRDNPRLLQLEAEYAALDLPFEHTLWAKHQHEGVNIGNFRSDGNYLGQGTLDIEEYRAMWNHVKSFAPDSWLDLLVEDGSFGALTLQFDYQYVSRDLCDSIMELAFVQEGLGKLPMRWLDIGAGYGRLAHRLNYLDPFDTYVTCVDAVPISTFLCEYYLRYRLCGNNVEVLPLTALNTIQPGDFDIACNIHSWSECSNRAIDFWLDNLVRWQVPYLFVVPHDERWICINEDGSVGDFKNNILARGYEEVYTRSKYPAGVQGLYPEVHYHLFELNR